MEECELCAVGGRWATRRKCLSEERFTGVRLSTPVGVESTHCRWKIAIPFQTCLLLSRMSYIFFQFVRGVNFCGISEAWMVCCASINVNSEHPFLSRLLLYSFFNVNLLQMKQKSKSLSHPSPYSEVKARVKALYSAKGVPAWYLETH